MKPKPKLPIYSSMIQCSGATGIPMPVLRAANKKGCPAFRDSRVSLGEFLPWWFKQDEGGCVDWFDRLKKAQAQREEMRLAKDKGQVLDKSEVHLAIAKATANFFSLLDRRSSVELPPALKGLNEIQIQAKLLESDEGLKTAFREQLQQYGGGK